MVQRVTITTDRPVDLKPLVESAIRSEVRMLEIGLERTRQRLRTFEERYRWTSEDFECRFNAGDVAESLDFIEWAGEIKTHQLLEAHRQALQGVRLSCMFTPPAIRSA